MPPQLLEHLGDLGGQGPPQPGLRVRRLGEECVGLQATCRLGVQHRDVVGGRRAGGQAPLGVVDVARDQRLNPQRREQGLVHARHDAGADRQRCPVVLGAGVGRARDASDPQQGGLDVVVDVDARRRSRGHGHLVPRHSDAPTTVAHGGDDRCDVEDVGRPERAGPCREAVGVVVLPHPGAPRRVGSDEGQQPGGPERPEKAGEGQRAQREPRALHHEIDDDEGGLGPRWKSRVLPEHLGRRQHLVERVTVRRRRRVEGLGTKHAGPSWAGRALPARSARHVTRLLARGLKDRPGHQRPEGVTARWRGAAGGAAGRAGSPRPCGERREGPLVEVAPHARPDAAVTRLESRRRARAEHGGRTPAEDAAQPSEDGADGDRALGGENLQRMRLRTRRTGWRRRR